MKRKSKMEKIVFTPEGEQNPVEFFVLEQTTIGGKNYILVTDEEEGDGDALILRDDSAGEDQEQGFYTIVEDDREFEAAAIVFRDLLADADIELDE